MLLTAFGQWLLRQGVLPRADRLFDIIHSDIARKDAADDAASYELTAIPCGSRPPVPASTVCERESDQAAFCPFVIAVLETWIVVRENLGRAPRVRAVCNFPADLFPTISRRA